MHTIRSLPLLTVGLLFCVAGSVCFVLLPPLALERVINQLTAGMAFPFSLALLYFATLALSGLFDALKEMMITVYGQKITHNMRSAMCQKLSRLPASYFSTNQPGATVSRFVNDVDTLETLFGSGIIGMFVDVCRVAGVLVVIFTRSPGLGLLMLIVTPLLFRFTRTIQKRILSAQLQNRAAIGRISGQLPETIRNIRMIRTLRKESYFEEKYDRRIAESYDALERTNFYDAIYSPVILVTSAGVVAIMMALASTGGVMQHFFGMSVGTAVAVISYVSKVFEPLDSIGMEVQSIQSAAAGIKRIEEFLREPERIRADESLRAQELIASRTPAVCLTDVDFRYMAEQTVLKGLFFTVKRGETVTFTGRTGAGKSTIFKLLLGYYSPQKGSVKIFGAEADAIPDSDKRRLFGYVEQRFVPVSGSVREQIAVYDKTLSDEDIQKAATLSGIHDAIAALPHGYQTPYADSLFSQGERQLLAIARAIAADPAILLLDEITANLDAETELKVLNALQNASKNRTVLSISHRLYAHFKNRLIIIQ
ncbi:MAG: ABC transporter ATP-binding protein/permease [Roseburia sp.]|nr:ABC transporter ATP-binding protein/permease [Roseburia sp.]